jgi:hypothetical protein
MENAQWVIWLWIIGAPLVAFIALDSFHGKSASPK